MCSSSAWSLVTVRVNDSPTPRSTVLGAGDTLVPVTVTTSVRPLELLEVLDEEDEEDEVEDELEDELVLVPAGSPPPPQAVRDMARASAAAYQIGTCRVIFVTNGSLDSA